MLMNLVEATAQLLVNSTLLESLLLEGLPLRIPYLNPLCEITLILCTGYPSNSSLRHIYLPRCLVGDAGCLALCKAVRCLPNVLTLDLSGCDITHLGAGYIAELIKYQKIHRYSENWTHTLRYRLPELDAMAGLRRISLCGNPQLSDAGAAKLFDVLADDLWIKAIDIQNCALTEETASTALRMMSSNTTLVVLDLRHNADISSESLSKIRTALRENERRVGGLSYSWLGSQSGYNYDGRSNKSMNSKNGVIKDRAPTTHKNLSTKYANKSTVVRREKDYTEVLEEQLQEEISHRQQLEELNIQLVDQMKQLKKHQIRRWANGPASSGSEQSFQPSSPSGELSSSSGSTSSVPIDQGTLSYIQQAFQDIYAFIKNNQCPGVCEHKVSNERVHKLSEVAELEEGSPRAAGLVPKKAQSSHVRHEATRPNKLTKSAHLLGHKRPDRTRESVEMKLDMVEKYMGDTNDHGGHFGVTEDLIRAQLELKKTRSNCDNVMNSASSSTSSAVSDSSETVVWCDDAPNPLEAMFSSDEDS
ncbi:hypothetical protein ACJJTC_000106 [Scirpophaga incertulas]